MLSDEEKTAIDHEMEAYVDPRAVCIDALRIVQTHRGWVSDEAIQDLAGYLRMTPDELDSVATFYNLIYRRPVGRHVILMCNSITCWMMGMEQVHEHLRSRLGVEMGETTPDNRFTFLPNVCLGICDHAPAMMIDEDTYTELNAAKIDQILERYS
jgi:NADH-quinone oxidoreductase subunit E